MNLDIIQRLVQILKEAPEVGAIEIRRGPFGAWTSVRVSKAGHGNASGAGGSGGGVTTVTAVPTVATAGAVPVAPPVSHLVEIKSPMVGTFYASPEPGAPPYVKVGSRIAPGQVVCIIEAMKIMNPIEAEMSGLIREVAVENAQPVEFGQVLFRVDPNA